jgi:hypothetical protein
MTLKEKIEKKIKKLKFKFKHNPYTIYEKQIEVLQWVLEQMEAIDAKTKD